MGTEIAFEKVPRLMRISLYTNGQTIASTLDMDIFADQLKLEMEDDDEDDEEIQVEKD